MARGFKVADGYVDVHASPDRASARRAAHVLANDVDNVGRRRGAGFFRELFTPNASILTALRTGIPAALASPVGAAALIVGAGFATALIASIISTLALGGLGGAFIALGAFAVRANDQIKNAFKDTISTISDGLADAAKPLNHVFLEALNIVRNTFTDEIQPLIETIFTGLAPAILPLTRAIGDSIVIFLEAIADPKVLIPLKDFMIALAEQLPRIAESMGDFFTVMAEHGPLITKSFAIVVSVLDQLLGALAVVLVAFDLYLIVTAFKWNKTWELAKNVFGKFHEEITSLWGDLKTIWSNLWPRATAVFNFFVTNVKVLWQGLKDRIQAVIANIKRIIATVAAAITNPFKSGISSAKNIFNTIRGFVGGVISKLGSIIARVKSLITNPVSAGIRGVTSLFNRLPSRIRNAVGNLGRLLYNKGRAVIQGLINGIASKFQAIKNTVNNIVGWVADHFPGSPVKLGPLRAFNRLTTNPGAKLADMFQEGFSQRMRDFTPIPSSAALPNITVNPTSNPVVRVYLDGRELSPTVVRIIDERDTQLKRAVSSGGARLP